MRAKVFFAPIFAANKQAVMFVDSSGVTPIKKSASFISTSIKSFREVQDPVIVIISRLEPRKLSFSLSASMSTTSWFSADNSFAKCVPTAPAPVITILIDSYLYIFSSILLGLICLCKIDCIRFTNPCMSSSHSFFRSATEPCVTNLSCMPARTTFMFR